MHPANPTAGISYRELFVRQTLMADDIPCCSPPWTPFMLWARHGTVMSAKSAILFNPCLINTKPLLVSHGLTIPETKCLGDIPAIECVIKCESIKCSSRMATSSSSIIPAAPSSIDEFRPQTGRHHIMHLPRHGHLMEYTW